MISIHFMLQWKKEPFLKTCSRCAILSILWASIFFGLRWLIPADNAEHAQRWSEYLNDNLTKYHWLQYTFVFLSSWTILPVLYWKKIPSDLKRLLLALVPYIILVFLFGRIREVRLFLPLCIPLIPATMLYVRETIEKTPQNS